MIKNGIKPFKTRRHVKLKYTHLIKNKPCLKGFRDSSFEKLGDPYFQVGCMIPLCNSSGRNIIKFSSNRSRRFVTSVLDIELLVLQQPLARLTPWIRNSISYCKDTTSGNVGWLHVILWYNDKVFEHWGEKSQDWYAKHNNRLRGYRNPRTRTASLGNHLKCCSRQSESLRGLGSENIRNKIIINSQTVAFQIK